MSTTPDMGSPRHGVMNARAYRSPLVFRVVRDASWTIAWLLALGCAAWARVIGQFRDAGCNAR